MDDFTKKGPFDRDVTDSTGRTFTFTQADSGEPWAKRRWQSGGQKKDMFYWRCHRCGGKEPVVSSGLVHDELMVPDPKSQLDAHDCEAEIVRTVMER